MHSWTNQVAQLYFSKTCFWFESWNDLFFVLSFKIISNFWPFMKFQSFNFFYKPWFGGSTQKFSTNQNLVNSSINYCLTIFRIIFMTRSSKSWFSEKLELWIFIKLEKLKITSKLQSKYNSPQDWNQKHVVEKKSWTVSFVQVSKLNNWM